MDAAEARLCVSWRNSSGAWSHHLQNTVSLVYKGTVTDKDGG